MLRHVFLILSSKMYRHLRRVLVHLKARERYIEVHGSEEDLLIAREHRIEIEERMREMRESKKDIERKMTYRVHHK